MILLTFLVKLNLILLILTPALSQLVTNLYSMAPEMPSVRSFVSSRLCEEEGGCVMVMLIVNWLLCFTDLDQDCIYTHFLCFDSVPHFQSMKSLFQQRTFIALDKTFSSIVLKYLHLQLKFIWKRIFKNICCYFKSSMPISFNISHNSLIPAICPNFPRDWWRPTTYSYCNTVGQ